MTENTELVIPQMATIRQTARMGIMSEYAQRLRLAQGTLPGYYAGSRYYVNLDRLVAEMNGDTEVHSK